MIDIRGLWAGYGGLDILRGLDLRVETGSIMCLVGPNGAGKSTVLKTISGILRPRSGSIVVDGTDITGRSPEAILRAGIVQVPQRHGLFNRLTVRQNVLMGGYVIRRRRTHLDARYAQLAHLFPLLAEQPNAPGDALSGGQRRTVEFARAMMLEPKVVLLDEPTLGLDPRSLAVVRDTVRTMRAAGTTVLMVEQNVRFGLSLAEHATVLNAGAAVMTGSAPEIADHPDLMQLFFGSTSRISTSGSGAVRPQRATP